MMMMKTGVAKQIMNRVLTIPRKHIIQLRKDMGSVSSTVEISWGHMIRWDGVLMHSHGILDFPDSSRKLAQFWDLNDSFI